MVRASLCGALLTAGAAAQAGDFVLGPDDTAEDLQAILDATTANGERDRIDLGGRTLILTEQLVIVPEARHDVKIRNGTLQRADGTPPHRLVEVRPQADVRLDRYVRPVVFEAMTFRGGRIDGDSDAMRPSGGGAILTNWPTTVRQSRFEDNIVTGDAFGGAVLARSEFVLDHTIFRANRARDDDPLTRGRGGAIALVPDLELWNDDSRSAELNARRSEFDDNRADLGGALYFSSTTDELWTHYINDTTLHDNEAAEAGGAIWFALTERTRLYTYNSTFAGNVAGGSGGAMNFERPIGFDADGVPIGPRLGIEFSTLVGNTANGGAGGALYAPFATLGEGIAIGASILGDNVGDNCASSDGGEFAGIVRSSITDDASCGSTGVTVVDEIDTLFIGGLDDHGGPTPTIALVPGGLAVDAVELALCSGVKEGRVSGPLADQRGRPRLPDDEGNGFSRDDEPVEVGTHCDIGAFEVQGGGDADDDGVRNDADNCPVIANEDQRDTDGDGAGDACDAMPNGDDDADGVDDGIDNCPLIANADQTDTDGDGAGDACDTLTDSDGDGIADDDDAFPRDSGESRDTDGDGRGDNADTDDDADGQSDADERACGSDPLDSASFSPDGDGDGRPDCVDPLEPTGAPLCDGVPATIYVGEDGHVVGGWLAGKRFKGFLYGTRGDDVIVGTEGTDVVFGLAGSDRVCLLGGDDYAVGGGGDDSLRGGEGRDRLWGQWGADTLSGDAGDDYLAGGQGADTLDGGSGDDMLVGGRGHDTGVGGTGSDRCWQLESGAGC